MTHDEKVQLAVEWFMEATPGQQKKAIEELFDHAIKTEWVNVWSPEDRQELAEEEGKSIEEYAIPYFRTCGEPISGDA